MTIGRFSRKCAAICLIATFGAAQAASIKPAGKIKMRKAPLFATWDQAGRQVFITCFASDDVVAYQPGAPNAETHFYGGYEPQGVAVTPAGDKLFVTNRRGLVKVIDTATRQIVDDIKVGGVPSNIVMSPGGLLAFVTNYGRGKIGRVDVIDTNTHRIVDKVEIGIRPLAAAVSPLGDQLFVVCAGSNDLYVIGAEDRRIIKQIPVGLGPNGLAFSPDGATLYVSNSATDDLSIIDTLDLKELRRAPVGQKPFSLAVDDAGRIFVVETGSQSLSVYSPEMQLIASVPAGKKPIDIVLTPDQRRAFVTDERKNQLLIFDLDF